MKKDKIIIGTIIAMMIILSACSKKDYTEPSQDIIKSDIQDYITGIKDENAVIEYLAIESDNNESGLYTAACIVSYQSDEVKYLDRFNVNYLSKDGEWVLKNVYIDNTYADKTEERLKADKEEPTKAAQDAAGQETAAKERESDTTESTPGESDATESTPEFPDIDIVIEAERGNIDENNVYTNEAFGISFQIPSFCTIFNDEEIVQLAGVEGVVFDENGNYTPAAFQSVNNGSFYDVWFCYPDGRSNIYVSYGDMFLSGLFLYDEAYIISEFKMLLEREFTYDEELAVEFSEDTTEVYGSRTYCCANGKANNGLSIKIMASKEANYLMVIWISCLDNTDILDSFLETLTTIE